MDFENELSEEIEDMSTEEALDSIALSDDMTGMEKLESIKERRHSKADKDQVLDMSDDARMERAKSMGFDVNTIYYHGTKSDIGDYIHVPFFITTDIQSAEDYADLYVIDKNLRKGNTKIEPASNTKILKKEYGEKAVNAAIELLNKKIEISGDGIFKEFTSDQLKSIGIEDRLADYVTFRNNVSYAYSDLTEGKTDYKYNKDNFLSKKEAENQRDFDLEKIGGANIIPVFVKGKIKKVSKDIAEKFFLGHLSIDESDIENLHLDEDSGVIELPYDQSQGGREHDSFVVVKANFVRSIWSAFDPNNADSANILDNVALDSVTGIEKVKLVKELKTVRDGLPGLSGFNKIAAIKRIKDIRVLLGAGNVVEKPKTIEPQTLGEDRSEMSDKDAYDREDYLGASKELYDFKMLHQFQKPDDVDNEYDVDHDPLADLADTAFIVEGEVALHGGSIIWGDFNASAFSASVFDAVGGRNALDSASAGGVYLDQPSEQIQATLALLNYFKKFLASDKKFAAVPAGVPFGTSSMDKAQAKKLLQWLINVAVNRKAGQDLTADQKKKFEDYAHDARIIHDYMVNRIRSTGSRNMLKVPELKQRYPHIDNQPWYDSAAPILDSVIMPGGIIGEIGKGGRILARVKIDENGVMTLYEGDSGLKKIDEPTATLSGIKTAIKLAFKRFDPDYIEKTKEYPDAPEGWTLNIPIPDSVVYQSTETDVKINYYTLSNNVDPGAYRFLNYPKDYKFSTAPSGGYAGNGNGYVSWERIFEEANNLVDYQMVLKMNQQALKSDDQPKSTQADADQAIEFLQGFIGKSQLSAVKSAMSGEEKQYFIDLMVSLEKQIKAMPKTYETDGQGENAVAYLHYFKGGADWYITEKDMESEQLQAFGLADLGYGGELGYISIQELIDNNVELDFHWTPKTIAQIKGKDDEPDNTNPPIPLPDDSNASDSQSLGTEGNQIQTEADQSSFVAELAALQGETNVVEFDRKLDDLASRIEASGLLDALDAELNAAADQLTVLLNEAEKSGKIVTDSVQSAETGNDSVVEHEQNQPIDDAVDSETVAIDEQEQAETVLDEVQPIPESPDSFLQSLHIATELLDSATALQAETQAIRKQKEADCAILQGVLDGVADLSDPTLPGTLESLYKRYRDDTEVVGLARNAINRYSSAILQKVKGLSKR